MYRSETIAAISTPPGSGGIGIIRISGEKAFEIGARIFVGKRPFSSIKSHTINYGKIQDPDTGEILDEILLSKLQKPNTFTREDIVEINCHGGLVVIRRILELIIREGASLAEPGEFTKRAFLNGRLDLAQAEAVIDLINSKTDKSSQAAVNQLEGKLSRQLRNIRQRLVDLIANIEVTVDYPEHDIEEITAQNVYAEICDIKQLLITTINNFETGRVIREGINAVIVGRPNVGKSSLLNELTGKNRAIVTEIPGTTRDIIEEYVNIKGIPVKIIDTAGIRSTEDLVEAIGVKKSQQAIRDADLVIMMLNSAEGITEEDKEILNTAKNKKLIVLLNKTDISELEPADEKLLEELLANNIIIKTSLLDSTGITELEAAIAELFLSGQISENSEILVTNIRHKVNIDNAIMHLDEACRAYESRMPIDCLSIDIKNAAEDIGFITGESVAEDVLKSIFSRFCLGK